MRRPEGRRLLEDLGVDGKGSGGSSAMLIILPDKDDTQFLYTGKYEKVVQRC